MTLEEMAKAYNDEWTYSGQVAVTSGPNYQVRMWSLFFRTVEL